MVHIRHTSPAGAPSSEPSMWPSDTIVCPPCLSCPTASTSAGRVTVPDPEVPTGVVCMPSVSLQDSLFCPGSHDQCLLLCTIAYFKIPSQQGRCYWSLNSTLKCLSDVTENRSPTRGARKIGLLSGAACLEEVLTVMFSHVSLSPHPSLFPTWRQRSSQTGRGQKPSSVVFLCSPQWSVAAGRYRAGHAGAFPWNEGI